MRKDNTKYYLNIKNQWTIVVSSHPFTLLAVKFLNDYRYDYFKFYLELILK